MNTTDMSEANPHSQAPNEAVFGASACSGLDCPGGGSLFLFAPWEVLWTKIWNSQFCWVIRRWCGLRSLECRMFIVQVRIGLCQSRALGLVRRKFPSNQSDLSSYLVFGCVAPIHHCVQVIKKLRDCFHAVFQGCPNNERTAWEKRRTEMITHELNECADNAYDAKQKAIAALIDQKP